MERKKTTLLYQGGFLSLKRAFIILAVLMLAGSLFALAFLDDIKLGDKTIKDIDLVGMTDGAPADAAIFKENTLTVVNVWATFCSPCIREMPEFGEVSREYAEKGVQFIGVCGDIPIDAADVPDESLMQDAYKIIEMTKADYPHYLPTTAYRPALGTLISSSYPGTFLVDADGNIRKLFVGSISKDVLVSAIESELAVLKGSETEAQS